MFIYFFVFGLIKKKEELFCKFLMKSPNLFYILEGPQNTFHNNIKKT